MGGMWRTAEFGIALGGAFAALAFGSDPVLLAVALVAGLFFAQLGIWTVKLGSLSTSSRSAWAIAATIFFIGEGIFVYVHAHPSLPAKLSAAKIDLLPNRPEPSAAVTEQKSAGRKVAPKILKRLLAYDDSVSFDYCQTQVGQCRKQASFRATNVGDDPVAISFLGGTVSVDGHVAMACEKIKFPYVGKGQTKIFYCDAVEETGFILTDNNNEMVLQYELEYDTIPSSGVRQSKRILKAPVVRSTSTSGVGTAAFALVQVEER